MHQRIHCPFLTAGFLASVSPLENLTLGLNVKIRYLIDPKCAVSGDPEYDSHSIKVSNDHIQFRIELPITYMRSCSRWGGTLMPFYEERFYGEYAAYPADFKKTRFYNYGVSLMWTYHF